jgi:hypothetical protein
MLTITDRHDAEQLADTPRFKESESLGFGGQAGASHSPTSTARTKRRGRTGSRGPSRCTGGVHRGIEGLDVGPRTALRTDPAMLGPGLESSRQRRAWDRGSDRRSPSHMHGFCPVLKVPAVIIYPRNSSQTKLEHKNRRISADNDQRPHCPGDFSSVGRLESWFTTLQLFFDISLITGRLNFWDCDVNHSTQANTSAQLGTSRSGRTASILVPTVNQVGGWAPDTCQNRTKRQEIHGLNLLPD